MKGLLFTYALAYGGSAVSLFNPFIGLLIYICFAIIKPEAMWYWSVSAGNYSRIVAVALLIGWAMHGFGRWDFGRARGVVAAFVGYLAWSVLSATVAPDPTVAWRFIENVAKIFLPFLAGITLIDSTKKLKQLAWVIMLSQGAVALELNLSYYAGFNRVREAGYGGMDNNCIAISMVAAAGLAFFLGLGERIWWRKGLAFVAATLMAHTVMFAMSRGGMVALIISGFVAFILIRKQPKHYAWLAVAVVVALRLAGPQVRERFASTYTDTETRDATAQSRLELWANCWDAMLKRPLLGAGPDHWGLIVEEYGWKRGKEAHTLWLQIGAELGFPGLGFLATFYGLAMLRLWRMRHDSADIDPWLPDVARMVIAALAGFIVAAQFVSLEGLELPYYVTLVGAGALKLASQAETAVEHDMVEDWTADATAAVA